MDQRSPRDGRVIEELGTYDPMVPETDARAILNGERINYWLGVGAQPSPKVGTLIKKYGAGGTHLEAQSAAIAKLSTRRAASIESARDAATKREMPKKEEPKPAEEPAAESTEAVAPEAVAPEAAAPEAVAAEAVAAEVAAPEVAAEATSSKAAE